MGRLIMRRIMPVKHVRLGIPIDLPFCLRFDEFSYIAINNHLTSVAFPGIIPELRCLFFCTECIIECFVHIILSNHMGTPILFYVLLELGSALGVGFSEDERFLQLQIVGTIAGMLRWHIPAINFVLPLWLIRILFRYSPSILCFGLIPFRRMNV